MQMNDLTLNFHLSELKSRIIKCLVVVFIFSMIAFYNFDILISIFIKPLIQIAPKKNFIFTGITDMFFLNINISVPDKPTHAASCHPTNQ